MECLPGWGPTPCSPTPSADVLSLALCLLLLRAPPCVLATPSCKEEEFPTGAVCCPKCRPGYRVKEACGEFAGTVCAPCTPGTFTAHLNGLRECLPCRVCDPGLGQVTRRNCSSTANTVCGCGRGHFCVREDGDACVQCRPHSACRPGQSVRETGSEGQDTWCEDCPPGTFSAGGTQPACTPWTKCSGLLNTVETPGTNSSDVTCSHRVRVISLVGTTSALIVLLVAIALGLRHLRTRKLCGEQQPGPSGSGPSPPSQHLCSVPQKERPPGPGAGLPV
nr:tumor necrosis factor receptor superfamily member 14 [Pipistrellus kuhlii]